eukprot:79617_1
MALSLRFKSHIARVGARAFSASPAVASASAVKVADDPFADPRCYKRIAFHTEELEKVNHPRAVAHMAKKHGEEIVSNRLIYDKMFYLPRFIHTFGASKAKFYAPPFLFQGEEGILFGDAFDSPYQSWMLMYCVITLPLTVGYITYCQHHTAEMLPAISRHWGDDPNEANWEEEEISGYKKNIPGTKWR